MFDSLTQVKNVNCTLLTVLSHKTVSYNYDHVSFIISFLKLSNSQTSLILCSKGSKNFAKVVGFSNGLKLSFTDMLQVKMDLTMY